MHRNICNIQKRHLRIKSISFILILLGVDGMWSSWDTWNSCSKTCDGGKRQRYRTCTNPKPKHPGPNCNGTNREGKHCNEQACTLKSKRSSSFPME